MSVNIINFVLHISLFFFYRAQAMDFAVFYYFAIQKTECTNNTDSVVL